MLTQILPIEVQQIKGPDTTLTAAIMEMQRMEVRQAVLVERGESSSRLLRQTAVGEAREAAQGKDDKVKLFVARLAANPHCRGAPTDPSKPRRYTSMGAAYHRRVRRIQHTVSIFVGVMRSSTRRPRLPKQDKQVLATY